MTLVKPIMIYSFPETPVFKEKLRAMGNQLFLDEELITRITDLYGGRQKVFPETLQYSVESNILFPFYAAHSSGSQKLARTKKNLKGNIKQLQTKLNYPHTTARKEDISTTIQNLESQYRKYSRDSHAKYIVNLLRKIAEKRVLQPLPLTSTNKVKKVQE